MCVHVCLCSRVAVFMYMCMHVRCVRVCTCRRVRTRVRVCVYMCMCTCVCACACRGRGRAAASRNSAFPFAMFAGDGLGHLLHGEPRAWSSASRQDECVGLSPAGSRAGTQPAYGAPAAGTLGQAGEVCPRVCPHNLQDHVDEIFYSVFSFIFFLLLLLPLLFFFFFFLSGFTFVLFASPFPQKIEPLLPLITLSLK